MRVPHPKKGFVYEVKTTDKNIKPDDNKELFFIESYQNITYRINDVNVIVPHIQLIFKQSIYKSMKKDADGNFVLTFVDKAKEHTVQLSDKPMQIKTDEGIIDV